MASSLLNASVQPCSAGPARCAGSHWRTSSRVRPSASSWNSTLSGANTAGSYWAASVTFWGSVVPTLRVGSSSIALTDGAAYELYTMSNGLVGIRRL